MLYCGSNELFIWKEQILLAQILNNKLLSLFLGEKMEPPSLFCKKRYVPGSDELTCMYNLSVFCATV